jgi:hypothetical protein
MVITTAIERFAPVRVSFIKSSYLNRGTFYLGRGVAAEPATMNENEIVIGMRDGYGHQTPFGISLPDLRQHVYVIGKTGSGKTTLLRNMIIQHIALGHGVGLIDPHGDLAEELLNHIPRWRTEEKIHRCRCDTRCGGSPNKVQG